MKLAVEFVILTGCRSGEARNATWDEIDGDTWTIPGERTKTGKPHRIPLSSRALELLDEARELGDGTALIFAAPRTGKPLSDNTLGKALRTAEIPATIHGMRASLRDWLAAEGVPYELAEAVLGPPTPRHRQVLPPRRPTRSPPPNHGPMGPPCVGSVGSDSNRTERNCGSQATVGAFAGSRDYLAAVSCARVLRNIRGLRMECRSLVSDESAGASTCLLTKSRVHVGGVSLPVVA